MSAPDLSRRALAELWSLLTPDERLLALRWLRRRRQRMWELQVERPLTGSPTIAPTCENTCGGGDPGRQAKRRAYRAAWMRKWREEQAKKRGGS